MLGNRSRTRDLVRVLALTLAVLSVLFLSQVSLHSHAKGQTEAACQVCQAAHYTPPPAAATEWLVAPLVSIGYVAPFVAAYHEELFFHDSPSRAPPVL
jgi:hypothetical protein